ncbi:transglycosylase domain-containing protein [Phytopseudomonas seleniipraecipitans]
MPPIDCQKMLILAEDKRASRHCGFDVVAIIRSLALTGLGKPHGGSTILQQLVRTITGHYEKSLKRKITEILLAYLVAQKVDRSLYPRVYLSVAYYGTGMEGFDKFFAKKGNDSCDEIHLASMAVARLKYPEPAKPNCSKHEKISVREKHLRNIYLNSSNTRIYSYVEAV